MNQSLRAISNISSLPIPPQTSFILPSIHAMSLQRYIDPNAIDVKSMKGRFAWEKIPDSDIYMPVIFRGETKYFCIKMLRKILHEYPEDIFYRSTQYQYRKSIDLYNVTLHEIDLLNRINSHHARWAYNRQAFTAADEIIRVSEFFAFYEHLRQISKAGSSYMPTKQNAPRPILNQVPQAIQHRPTYTNNPRPVITHIQVDPSPRPPTQRPACPPPLVDFNHEISTSIIRALQPTPSILRQPRPTKSIGNPLSVISRTPNILPPPAALPPPLSLPVNITIANNETDSKTQVVLNHPQFITDKAPVVIPSPTVKQSSSSTDTLPLPTASPLPSSSSIVSVTNTENSRKLSSSSISALSSTSTSKPSSNIHCGWLQINKLYTPYVCTSTDSHHQYRIPVSLLTYYDLLKASSTEINNDHDQNELSNSFEQVTATGTEIELINDQCIRHNLRPFALDTKLITLETFYQFCAPSIIFVKELPLSEPKASICKEWPSIVQISGGICRLRNMNTLHEQTVPFIGNNLLKNFILSSQCLNTASLTKPTDAELEFLQLILFYSNLSISLRHAQLVDIESVRKEYNVDLILLFNDKFPLNVLNCQDKGNRTNTSQGSVLSSTSTAASNTFGESTPPPSRPSPANNKVHTTPTTTTTSQLPLTSSTPSSRYQKVIEFHGHRLTAYICSGVGSNVQRECVSVKSLCNILAPDSQNLDKLELKMLRLLRAKNVNRFRPQNQQSISFTRLINVRDAETHWTFLEQEMRAAMIKRSETSSISTMTSKSSDADILTNHSEPIQEMPIETMKADKRPLEEALNDENVPVLERMHKRMRLAECQNEQTVITSSELCSNTETNDSIDNNPTPTAKTLAKKRLTPFNRSKKKFLATWATKYAVEDCCIFLDAYQSTNDIDKD